MVTRRRGLGNRRYRHVDVTLMVPTKVTLLVSNIPDDDEKPDGLPNEWDVEKVISHGASDLSGVIKSLTDEELREIDAIAATKKDMRYE